MSLSMLRSGEQNQQSRDGRSAGDSGDFVAAKQSAAGRPMLKIGPYPYTLHHEMGQTNMSCTWRARESNGEVVLKIARWDQADQFKRNQHAIDNEEHWLRKLQEQDTSQIGLVKLLPLAGSGQRKIYSAKTGEAGNPRFISLAYLPGGSLQNLVQNGGKVPVKQALNILRQLADTLRCVHHNGCVHLDMKNDNIMFRQEITGQSDLHEVQSVLIDFGIAGEMGTRQYVGGVARWLSPECLAAKERVEKIFLHPGMDIYPLGLILHYMITGQLPKPNGRPAPIDPSVLRRDPTVPKRYQKLLARELTQFIEMMIAPEVDKRPRAKVVSRYAQLLMQERTDAQALGQVTTEKIVETDSVPLRNVWRSEPPQPSRRVNRVGIIASMLGVLALTVLLLWQVGVSSSGSASVQAQPPVQETVTQETVTQEASKIVAASPDAQESSSVNRSVAQVITKTELAATAGISPDIDSSGPNSPDIASTEVISTAIDAAHALSLTLASALPISLTIASEMSVTNTLTATNGLAGSASITSSLDVDATEINGLEIDSLAVDVVEVDSISTVSNSVTSAVTNSVASSVTNTVLNSAANIAVRPPTLTPTSILTPTSTAASVPASTPTSMQTEPATVIQTATPVPTFTDIPTRAAPPTSTSIPVDAIALAPTRTPTLAPTRMPTQPPAQSLVQSLAQSPTRPVPPTPFQTAVPSAPLISTRPPLSSVALVQPANGAAGAERVLFEWRTDAKLGANELFEVAFWKAGQDPFVHAFGLVGAGTYTSAQVNLLKLSNNRADLLTPRNEYLWGVWIVRANDGKRLRLVSEQRRFIFTEKK